MPMNAGPEYKAAEQHFREAITPEDRVTALEEMLRTVPKHKGTEKAQADIKRRLAKERQVVQASHRKGSSGQTLYHVDKTGAGQVALIGPPNAGKSRLVTALTHARPEVADYPYTTQVPLAGMMAYQDVQVQLVDLPPVCRTVFEPWVLGLARNADAVLVVLDVATDDVLSEATELFEVLDEHRLELMPPDAIPAEGDGVAGAGKPALIAANKVDLPGAAANLELLLELLGDRLPLVAVSAGTGQGLPDLAALVFDALHVIRIYTKAPGRPQERAAPYVLPAGSTVMDVARHVHADFYQHLRYARIWGTGRLQGQMVGRDDVLNDGDLIELHA
jgi:uncharacterized protein